MQLYSTINTDLAQCKLTISMASQFAIEGGKLYFAEALFQNHRFVIRCEKCAGNAACPGFIKSSGGNKTLNARSHRLWACQRSNGTGIIIRCPRVSCTEYIAIAQRRLPPSVFINTLRDTHTKYATISDPLSGLLGYTKPTEQLYSEPTVPQATTLKRKAVGILSDTKCKSHHSTQQQRVVESIAFNKSNTLQSIAQELDRALKTLRDTIETIGPWPAQLRNIDLGNIFQGGYTQESFAATPSVPSLVKVEPSIAWDAVIPCTYPSDLYTSPAPPESPIKCPSSATARDSSPKEDGTLLVPYSDPATSSSESARVQELIVKFNHSPDQRGNIRRAVKGEGIHVAFQKALSRQPLQPITPKQTVNQTSRKKI